MKKVLLNLVFTFLVTNISAQNVGIGTTAPTNKLQVVGITRSDTIAIGTSSPRSPLSFAQQSGEKITFWDDGNAGGGTYGIGIAGGLMQIHAYTAADNIGFGYGSSSFFTEVMRIKGNGNVGIGTATPSNKLTVNGNADFTGNVGIGISSSSYKLHLNNGNNSLRIEGPSLPGSGGNAISVGGNGEIQIDKPGTAGGRFIIKENGNIGIDNNNPAAKLDVNGYTKLGESSPTIKMKLLTGTMAASQTPGGSSNEHRVYIPHGIDDSRILAVNILVHSSYFDIQVGPNYPKAGLEFYYSVGNGLIALENANLNSIYLLSRPFRVLIIYTE